jgi:PAS domain S-box-containing protein
MIENDGLVNHTNVVLTSLEQLVSSLKDAETGGRGFVITGDERFLQSYNIAVGEIPQQIARLKQLTSDNPVQQRRFPELENLIDRKLSLVGEGVGLRRSQGFTRSQQFVASGAGKAEMDAIRGIVGSMQDEENRLLDERMKASAASSRKTLRGFGFATLLAIAFVIAIFGLLRREQQLRIQADESASQLRAIYENAAVGIKQVAPDGHLLMVNPALCRMLGYSKSELLQKSFTEVTHPDDRIREATLLEAMVRGERDFYELEKRCLRRDGSPIWVSMTSSMVRDSAGLPLYGVVVLQDIDERKQTQEALQASEERYRSLFNTMDEGFCIIEVIFDAEGRPADYRFLVLNAAFEKQTGLHEAQGKLMRDLAPDHEAHWFEIYGKIALTGEPLHFVNEARELNRWYDVRAYRVGEPELRRVAIIFNDISDNKRAEEALRASELQFRTLADAIPQLSWMANPDGWIFWYNQRWYEYTGTTPEQMQGWAWQSVHHPETLPKVIEKWQASIVTGEFFEMVFPLRGADGVFRPFLTRVVPVKDAEGKVIRWFGTNTDISAQKQAEEQIRELNQQLEDRVRRRTAELETANKELEAFSYSVSHDLRGPLRTMDGFSQALMEDHSGGLDEKGRHYLDRIRAAAQRMGHLIDDLLQLSRLSRAEMQIRPVDLSAMALKVIDELQGSEPARIVDVHIEPGLVVRGDPGLLHVAMYNLLTNAWKFTSRRERALIEFGRVSDRSLPAFFVRDNGAGFDMQYAEHLFSPFQRLHAEEQFKGTGIGLATVQRIIRRHYGRIWAEAAEGKGATFYFELGSRIDPPAIS